MPINHYNNRDNKLDPYKILDALGRWNESNAADFLVYSSLRIRNHCGVGYSFRWNIGGWGLASERFEVIYITIVMFGER